jgi:parvulin-like peptidyl-prolyl isomerase
MESSDSWYVVRLTRRRPAGLAPFEEVRDRVKGDAAVAQQAEQAKQGAETILNSVRAGSSFEDAAKLVTGATSGVTDEFARRGFVRGLGNDPIVMDQVFTAPPGLLPSAITTKRGAYVLQILSRTAADESAFATQRESIRQSLIQRQRRRSRTLTDGLRTQAKIEDFRFESQI